MTLQKDPQQRATELGPHLGLVILINLEDYANAILVLFVLALLLTAFSLIPDKETRSILKLTKFRKQK